MRWIEMLASLKASTEENSDDRSYRFVAVIECILNKNDGEPI